MVWMLQNLNVTDAFLAAFGFCGWIFCLDLPEAVDKSVATEVDKSSVKFMLI